MNMQVSRKTETVICENKEDRQESHLWEKWRDTWRDYFQQERRCARCGIKEWR